MADLMPVHPVPHRLHVRRLAADPAMRGLIRPIYAGAFDLDPQGGFDQARDVVDIWLRTHDTVRPYVADRPPGDFEIERHLERDHLIAQRVTSPDGNTIVYRLQHQERDRDGTWDPIRNWRTEVTLDREADGDQVWIATRQFFTGVASDKRRCSPPRFIRTLLEKQALSDLDIMVPGPRVLDIEAEAGPLADLLLDEDRDFPVVVLADGCPLNAERVATDSAGLAHVVRLSRHVRLALMVTLAENSGEAYELQHGAVSTFYPPAHGKRPLAPAAKFETIIGWHGDGESGPPAFAHWLHEEIARAVVLRMLNDPAHRTVEKIKANAVGERRVQLSEQRPSAQTVQADLEAANEIIALYEEDNDKLSADIKELTLRAEAYLNESKSLGEALRNEERRNWALQTERASLLHLLATKNGQTSVVIDAEFVERLIDSHPAPQTVVDAVEAAKNLFGLYGARVVVSDTAFTSSFDSPFKRPTDVLAALLRLGFLWKDIRNTRRPIEETVRQVVRFPCALHESLTATNKFGGERIATFDGGQAQLEKHVKIGSGGADASVRIYFGDNAEGELLIGHVGRHLTVAKTQ
ncbi:MAG TPA: hypothetical protein VMD91_07790 [Candidatus Sulfotelmatobacter sp.]|nr:hypothetical protein [Candidatus Sulfotelmatobacter sp.]